MHNIYYISVVDDIFNFDLSSFQVMISPHVVWFLRNLRKTHFMFPKAEQ